MMPRPRSSWPSRLLLILLACASGVASAAIVSGATGRTRLQSAVLAALAERRVVVHTVTARATATATPAGDTASTPAPSVTEPAATTPSDTSTASPSTTSTTSTTTTTTTSTTTSTTPTPKAYKVKHVFVIALTTTSYAAAFGRGSSMSYLAGTLVPKGTLLKDYATLGQSELPDYLALVSGQAPNADTRANCATYSEFPSSAKPNAAGLMPGAGCVYPNTVLTIGDEVTAAGHTWKAYIDGLNGTTCIHPNSGAVDNAALTGATSQYDTRHNPFIYFHSLLDLGDCASDDEPLSSLTGDLSSASQTPTYAFIAPGACEDASQSTCPASGSATAPGPGGMAAEDAFLTQWVPLILHSNAYRDNGALVIVFAAAQTATSPPSHGPVRTGALILSRYARHHRVLTGAIGPYGLLRTISELLGLTPLGHAKHARSIAATAFPSA